MLSCLKCPPLAVPDKDLSECMICDKAFGMMRSKHHCRFCARLLCSVCCGKQAPSTSFPPAFSDAGASAAARRVDPAATESGRGELLSVSGSAERVREDAPDGLRESAIVGGQKRLTVRKGAVRVCGDCHISIAGK